MTNPQSDRMSNQQENRNNERGGAAQPKNAPSKGAPNRESGNATRENRDSNSNAKNPR